MPGATEAEAVEVGESERTGAGEVVAIAAGEGLRDVAERVRSRIGVAVRAECSGIIGCSDSEGVHHNQNDALHEAGVIRS